MAACQRFQHKRYTLIVKKIFLVLTLVILLLGGGVYYWRFMAGEKQPVIIKQEVYENPFEYFSVSKKTYPVVYKLLEASDVLVVINKKHSLPADYVPEIIQSNGVSLRAEAMDAYQKLIAGAKNDGVVLYPISSYRSYADQEKLFNGYVAKDGQEEAEKYSARPGHSEHQTGLAIDIGLPSGACNLELCMAQTKQGLWLAENAHLYGFIIRYPNGKEVETGYQYEPWHIRYVGTEIAKAIYDSGYTLDAYFGITAGDYISQATTN